MDVRTRHEEGSIFLETLVASAILALVLGAALMTIADSARRSTRADAARATLVEARSRLAAAGIDAPLAAGSTSGIDGDLAWRLDIVPYGGGSGLAGPLMRVSATAADPRVPGSQVTLATLRLGHP